MLEEVHQHEQASVQCNPRSSDGTITIQSKAIEVVGLLILRDDICKPMVVTLLEVTPHRLVRAKTLVIFAVHSGAPEAVPKMSVGVGFAQGFGTLDEVRLVLAAKVLDDFGEV
jgi:hypothetical protein